MKVNLEKRYDGQLVPVSMEIENDQEVEFLLNQFRPKGEWVEAFFENDDEEGTKTKSFICSCCGASRVAGLGNAKFCYNCGADMRKGGTE